MPTATGASTDSKLMVNLTMRFAADDDSPPSVEHAVDTLRWIDDLQYVVLISPPLLMQADPRWVPMPLEIRELKTGSLEVELVGLLKQAVPLGALGFLISRIGFFVDLLPRALDAWDRWQNRDVIALQSRLQHIRELTAQGTPEWQSEPVAESLAELQEALTLEALHRFEMSKAVRAYTTTSSEQPAQRAHFRDDVETSRLRLIQASRRRARMVGNLAASMEDVPIQGEPGDVALQTEAVADRASELLVETAGGEPGLDFVEGTVDLIVRDEDD